MKVQFHEYLKLNTYRVTMQQPLCERMNFSDIKIYAKKLPLRYTLTPIAVRNDVFIDSEKGGVIEG